jgi:GT2 family glycosyltransferase
MDKGPSISVIIPNFNGVKLLENNLPSVIRALKKIPYSDILIVDDASTDKSIPFINKYYPEIQILLNPENEGFARSVNRGIFESESDLVFILNNDIQLDENYFKHMLCYFKERNTFGVMGTIKDAENKKREEGLKYPYFTFSEIRFKDILVSDSYSGPWIPTLYLCGGNALIDRKKLIKLGGLSLRYEPFYNEDLDLSLRAWMHDWKCYYEPRAHCIHLHSATIRQYYESDYISRISRRNRLMLNYLYLNSSRKKRFLIKFRFKYNLYRIFHILGIPSSYLAYRDFRVLWPELYAEGGEEDEKERIKRLHVNIKKIRTEIDGILSNQALFFSFPPVM